MAGIALGGINTASDIGMGIGNMLNQNEQNRLTREQQLLLLERQANYNKDSFNQKAAWQNHWQSNQQQFDRSIFDKQYQKSEEYYNRDVSSLRAMGLDPGMLALSGSGARGPAYVNQVGAQGSSYRSTMPGNPASVSYMGGRTQTANGMGALF